MLLLKKRGISILVSTAAMSLLHKKLKLGESLCEYTGAEQIVILNTDNHNVHQRTSCLTVVTLINSQDIEKEIAPCKAQTTIWGKTVFLLSQLLQKYILVVFVACI